MIRVLLLALFASTVDAATLVARASSGFTTATTWGVGEAGSGAEQLTRDNATNTTTSYVYPTAAFTVTLADSIEGLMLRCKRVNTTGTVTVTLSADSGTTPGQEVTVNASDLPATDDSWVFFKFGTPMTGLGTATYKVGIKGSSAANATFYRSITTAEWTRILRTAATQVPVAADTFYIAGEWTAAATETPLNVTMDETATTDYGSMDIGYHGSMTYGVTASTNYVLKMSGNLNVWNGGTLSIGTTGTPMPSTSTAKLNFDSGSNVQYGMTINNQGSFVAQGATKTVRALLAADASAAATSLTTNVSTNWANGDEIAIASTTRTASEGEKKSLTAGASGTTLTIAAITNAHLGTSPMQAELANLTRNVQVFGASASLQTYVVFGPTATADMDYVEFYWMGSSGSLKRGVNVATTTGAVNMQYCSFHDFVATQSLGLFVDALITTGTVVASHNVYALVASAAIWVDSPSTGTGWTFDDNLMIKNTDNAPGFYVGVVATGSFTNNTITGAVGNGVHLAIGNMIWPSGSFSGNTVHSNGVGIKISSLGAGSFISNTTSWRNNGYGFDFDANDFYRYGPVVVDGLTAWGNTTANVNAGANPGATFVFNNFTLNGDTTFTTLSGIAAGGVTITLNNSSLGVASGIKTTHSTADINPNNSQQAMVYGSNVTLASTTPVNQPGQIFTGSTFAFSKYGGVSGAQRSYIADSTSTYTITTNDTVIFHTASPSQRITPATVANRFRSSYKQVALNSGATTTFSVWVRKSSSGDAGGANYNGAEPRLMVQTNAGCGIGDGANDVVGDTMTAAVGNWEQLTYTTSAVSEDCVLLAYIDGNGTAGWINTDDWGVTNPQNVGTEKYWFNGGTNLTISGAGSAPAATVAYPLVQ